MPISLALFALGLTACPDSTPPEIKGELREFLTVGPVNRTVSEGRTLQMTALALFTDGTGENITTDPNTTWSSSDTGVAEVSSRGVIRAITVGSIEITATYQLKDEHGQTLKTVSGKTNLWVRARLVRLEIAPVAPVLAVGTKTQLRLTGILRDKSKADVTAEAIWGSDYSAVATVASGAATGVQAGTATISASYEGISVTAPLRVNDTALTGLTIANMPTSIPKGESARLTAKGTFADGSSQTLTDQVQWDVTSGNEFASVSQTGSLTTRAPEEATEPGTVMVKAERGGVVATAMTQVILDGLSAIDLTGPAMISLQGVPARITATGTFGAVQWPVNTSVSWQLSKAGLVLFASGSVTPRQTGSLTVTASRKNTTPRETVDSIPVTLGEIRRLVARINPEPIKDTLSFAIIDEPATITPSTMAITAPAANETVAVTAQATFATAVAQNVTGAVVWESSQPDQVAVGNSALDSGVVTIRTAGGRGNVTGYYRGMQKFVIAVNGGAVP